MADLKLLFFREAAKFKIKNLFCMPPLLPHFVWTPAHSCDMQNGRVRL